MRVAMRNPAAVATVMLSLGLVAPAPAATTDPHASCSAKLSTMFNAGDPGARADVSHDARAEANSLGLTLGDFQSEVAHDHGPAEFC
jgi:hypothetical protein